MPHSPSKRLQQLFVQLLLLRLVDEDCDLLSILLFCPCMQLNIQLC